jgi:hypothetical protein
VRIKDLLDSHPSKTRVALLRQEMNQLEWERAAIIYAWTKDDEEETRA